MTFLPDMPYWLLLPIAAGLIGLCVWRLVAQPTKRLDWARRTLMAMLVTAMVLRPGVPGGEVPTGSIDVNVFLAIDTSQSIAAEDWGDAQPRLDGIRQDVRDIAYAFAGADISVITFDSEAELRVPLTDDGSAIIEMVNALRPEIAVYSHGSSISAARDTLQSEIERSQQADPEAPTLLFYLGDGEQTADDEPQSFDTLAPLVDGGMVLGYGTDAGGRMLVSSFGAAADEYVQDPTTNEDAISVIDEQTLQTIADDAGISYLHRSADAELAPALEAMTGGQGETDLSQYEEARLDLYWVLATPLFLLLLWEAWVLIRSARSLRTLRGSRS